MLGLIFNGASKLAKTVGNTVIKGREAWKGNVEKREIRTAQARADALEQFGKEFIKPENWFDSLINGMNRLPRPLLALGTIGLFVYAFIDPVGFSITMASLDLIPPELWYLFGAIVTFYFGVREFSSNRKHKQTLAHMDAKVKDNAKQSAVAEDEIDNPPLTKLQQFQARRNKD